MGRKRNEKETTDAPDLPAGPPLSSSAKDGTSTETTETEGSKPRKRKRRRKRRSGSQSAGLPTPAETTVVESSGRDSNDPQRAENGEAEIVSRAETVRSAGPTVDGAKPRKRRRRRRRGGAQKTAPQSAESAAVSASSGEALPERMLSGEQGAPENEMPPGVSGSAAVRAEPAEKSAGEGPNEDAAEHSGVKVCLYCGEPKPLGDFLRRTGKRSGRESRRGACRDCRKRRRSQNLEALDAASDPLPPSDVARPHEPLPEGAEAAEAAPKRRIRRPPPEPPADALLEPTREMELRPTRQGTIRMRGRTDKGRRWQQETDLEMARCLVREHAAVLVNRFTIRRLYTNRSFRRYILERDRYTCHFCGEYGDTIDHLLPRAKGGHTTPLNCVCACMLCNQNKADRDLDEFMEDAEPFDAASSENASFH